MTMIFHPDNTIPVAGWIWVFGSNLGGKHGKGAARIAHQNFQARYGVGQGRSGNAYAIPTKDKHLEVLPLAAIEESVQQFIAYANANPRLKLFITRVGCGLAGYSDEQIAPMFKALASRSDVSWPRQWAHIFQPGRRWSMDAQSR